MGKFIQKGIFLLLIIISALFFFQKTFTSGLLPIPADDIVGLYYPYRDIYAKEYPRGVPFKNFLITDPIRQSYPWKNLVASYEKNFSLPLWNPYNFSGTPLLANFQSGSFYPFNLLFLVLPFVNAWTFLIILQPVLAGIFMFLFLNNLKLRREASTLGALAFSFCGFFVAWMEWGNVVHTALWLPLILLAADKVFEYSSKNKSKKKPIILWFTVLLTASISSFFAGHVQVFFYMAIVVFFYVLLKWIEYGRKRALTYPFILYLVLFAAITAIQWIPTLRFIGLSARNVDALSYTSPGWFIPLQHMIQLVAPDFFGNPATLNYFGTWNYGEFVGYIGIVPLVMAVTALLTRRDKKTIFFGVALILSLIFALPTFFAKIPFLLQIPFLSTSQPTRLMFIVDFSLCVLAALGLDTYLKDKKKVLFILPLIGIVFLSLWIFVLGKGFGLVDIINISVSKQNLILPTGLFVLASFFLVAGIFIKHKAGIVLVFLLLFITVFDLLRFGWKYEAFAPQKYLYPDAPVLSFIQAKRSPFRVISTESQIFPPNFSIMYKIQTPDGYDPLYLSRYGELAAANARKKPDIAPPFGFNRIITIQNPDTRIVDLMGVRYVLSLFDLESSKLKKVFTNGTIRVYENIEAFPRAFFVSSIFMANNKQEAINAMFDNEHSLKERAVVEGIDRSMVNKKWGKGTVNLKVYSANRISISTVNEDLGFLVLTDSYYPTWRAKIDGKETPIYLTDYSFRGIVVPEGEHTVEFYNTLL